MEVKHYTVFLELKDIFQSQTIKNSLHVHVKFSLLGFRFEVSGLAIFKKGFDVLSKILLVYFFIERTVLIHDDALSLLIEKFDLVSDPVVNTFVKYSENIILFPDVNMNIFEVLLCLEKFPIIELFELFFLHDLLQFW